MGCGCKGGSWSPPSLTAAATKAAGGKVKGPRAPGYFAPSKSSGAVAKKTKP